MVNEKFVVKLSGEERVQLTGLISKNKTAAKTVLKARILLRADQGEAGGGWADERICEALDTNVSMVSRVRETFVMQGLDAVPTRKQRKTPPVAPIFDGQRQAQLIALACSSRRKATRTGPSGCWLSMPSSAKLRKPRTSTRLAGAKPHLKEYWVIPPKAKTVAVIFGLISSTVLDHKYIPPMPLRPPNFAMVPSCLLFQIIMARFLGVRCK